MFCRCAVTSSAGCYRNVQMSNGNCLEIQALVWLLMVQFRAVLFGAVHFGTEYTNLRQPRIFKHQISGKNLVLPSSKYGMMQIDSLRWVKSLVQRSSLASQICRLLSKMWSLAILLRRTCREKNVARRFVKIFHINSVVLKKATYRITMHVLKLSLQQNSLQDFMVQKCVKYKMIHCLN